MSEGFNADRLDQVPEEQAPDGLETEGLIPEEQEPDGQEDQGQAREGNRARPSFWQRYPRVSIAMVAVMLIGSVAVVFMFAKHKRGAEMADGGDSQSISSGAADFLPSDSMDTDKPAKPIYYEQNTRIKQEAEGYSERYSIDESHTVNRSKAFVLNKEREIDIEPQIEEFEQVRKAWDELISDLLMSEDGKRLAQDETLLEGFIELYGKRPLRPQWAKAMREQLDILLRPVVDTIPQRYSQRPGQELEGEIRDVASKATNTAKDIRHDISVIRGLIARAPKDIPQDAPTLAKAIVDYDAIHDSQEFLDLRDAKKKAEKKAKEEREKKILEQQRKNKAVSDELHVQAKKIKEGLDRLAQETNKLNPEKRDYNRNRSYGSRYSGYGSQPRRSSKPFERSQPLTREEMEENAKWKFALASSFRPIHAPGAKERGGVILSDYGTQILAPQGREKCQIWKSKDGTAIYIHAGGKTLAVSATRVSRIIYPSKSSK